MDKFPCSTRDHVLYLVYFYPDMESDSRFWAFYVAPTHSNSHRNPSRSSSPTSSSNTSPSPSLLSSSSSSSASVSPSPPPSHLSSRRTSQPDTKPLVGVFHELQTVAGYAKFWHNVVPGFVPEMFASLEGAMELVHLDREGVLCFERTASEVTNVLQAELLQAEGEERRGQEWVMNIVELLEDALLLPEGTTEVVKDRIPT
ncbi:hypothetical protein SISSUDRAFT_1058327 [Sistotremastrum suecicum HHB10207 ss-3]|uniref:Uncharacterized protein n=1 Tax=Sistotremastrum suecicum HHB10207 ss-3 TaxID=1314776 RepID=A0A166HM30_9AGAM|nr:hypothetical protein SISSUDRAFT_1058327 [Sistotremastrum suecicum HHB10207 ss-3]